MAWAQPPIISPALLTSPGNPLGLLMLFSPIHACPQAPNFRMLLDENTQLLLGLHFVNKELRCLLGAAGSAASFPRWVTLLSFQMPSHTFSLQTSSLQRLWPSHSSNRPSVLLPQDLAFTVHSALTSSQTSLWDTPPWVHLTCTGKYTIHCSRTDLFLLPCLSPLLAGRLPKGGSTVVCLVHV